MVLKFFTGTLIMLIIVGIITAIIYSEKKRSNSWWNKETEKYNKAISKIYNIMFVILIFTIIAFIISNFAILIYGIINKNLFFKIIGVTFCIGSIFGILFKITDKFYYFIVGSLYIITASYIALTIFFLFWQTVAMQNSTTIVRKVNTINIIELEKVPYTNVSGTRWYIRSEPSLAYYYDIVTENGGSTTKVIDGYKDYVEKYEDDIYKENPHIDVFEVVKKYTTGYGVQNEIVESYEYHIYVPKDGIYYTDKE